MGAARLVATCVTILFFGLTVAFLKMRRSLEEANQRNMQLEAALAKAASAHGAVLKSLKDATAAAEAAAAASQRESHSPKIRKHFTAAARAGAPEQQALHSATPKQTTHSANMERKQRAVARNGTLKGVKPGRKHQTVATNTSSALRQAEFPLPLRSIRPDINQDDPPAPLVPGTCTGSEGFRPAADHAIADERGLVSCSFAGRQSWAVKASAATLETAAPIMVAGCARGNEYILRLHAIQVVDDLVARFPGSAAYIYTDGGATDSNRTWSALIEWVRRRPETVHAILAHAELPDRIQRLAMCRNVLMGEARKHLPPKGFFVALDLDCRHSTPAQYAAKLEFLARNEHVDAIAANNPGPYRDMWALRSEALSMDYDCFWSTRAHLAPGQVIKSRTGKLLPTTGNCKGFRIVLHRDGPLVPVESAFNGAAIYKAKTLLSPNTAHCRYKDLTLGRFTCEHVRFHQCLAQRGLRMFIDPSFCAYCHAWYTPSPQYRFYVFPNGTMSRFSTQAEKELLYGYESEIEWQGLNGRQWCSNIHATSDVNVYFEHPFTGSACCRPQAGPWAQGLMNKWTATSCFQRAPNSSASSTSSTSVVRGGSSSSATQPWPQLELKRTRRSMGTARAAV